MNSNAHRKRTRSQTFASYPHALSADAWEPIVVPRVPLEHVVNAGGGTRPPPRCCVCGEAPNSSDDLMMIKYWACCLRCASIKPSVKMSATSPWHKSHNQATLTR